MAMQSERDSKACLLLRWLAPLLLLAIAANLLYNRFRPGLRHIPGPTLAKYTRLWRFYNVWKGDAHHTAIELHKKYGPLVRIGPTHVSVGDPKEIGNIYGLNKGFTKTGFYPLQAITWHKKAQMNLFSTQDEAYHREQKRPIANAYSLGSLLAKEGAVDSCSTLFIEQLGIYADRGEAVDLGTWLQYYAFDVTGELTFATKLGFLEQGKDIDGMMAAISGLLDYASLIGQVPEWHTFLLGNPMLPYLLPSMENWNEVLNFTIKAVNSVNDSLSFKKNAELDPEALDAKGDMLSRWSAVKLSDPTKMNTRDIVVHLSTNVFAGSDTTAIALRAIFYFLLKNPAKMKKLVRQINEADVGRHLSNPISYKEAITHLPYLNAVIKESVRLHPSVGLLLERHVPPGGNTICNTHIPGNTIVGINAWVTQQDPSVFDSPEEFRPERWMESEGVSVEKIKEMDTSYFAFGAGSRTCLGRNISIIEMTKVVPQILREFEVRLDPPEREWKVTNKWFVQQEDFIVKLERRRH